MASHYVDWRFPNEIQVNYGPQPANTVTPDIADAEVQADRSPPRINLSQVTNQCRASFTSRYGSIQTSSKFQGRLNREGVRQKEKRRRIEAYLDFLQKEKAKRQKFQNDAANIFETGRSDSKDNTQKPGKDSKEEEEGHQGLFLDDGLPNIPARAIPPLPRFQDWHNPPVKWGFLSSTSPDLYVPFSRCARASLIFGDPLAVRVYDECQDDDYDNQPGFGHPSGKKLATIFRGAGGNLILMLLHHLHR